MWTGEQPQPAAGVSAITDQTRRGGRWCHGGEEMGSQADLTEDPQKDRLGGFAASWFGPLELGGRPQTGPAQAELGSTEGGVTWGPISAGLSEVWWPVSSL